jgi:hypothetical protein
MSDTKLNYDEEADVLYVSFGQSEHVTGVGLAPTGNILLRLDTGQATQARPRAIGLTFLSYARLLAHYRNRPLNVPLSSLQDLPAELQEAVLAVVMSPPVSDFLSVGLSISPHMPPLPEQLAVAA